MRFLVTGFEPFLNHTVNPTALLADGLDGMDLGGAVVHAAKIPVGYVRADAAFEEAFDRVRPDAVLMFGLAAETDSLRLERVALNIDDTPHADNDGMIRKGRPIDPDGPVGYWSTLPLTALQDRMEEAGFPVSTSRDCGGYLCNHLFFRARHLIERRGLSVPAGFIHVPPLPEQVAGRADRTGLPLHRLTAAACLAIQVVRESLTGEA
ncbi:MAG TPA: pyrrolidone-carboxylate peptidase [Azospirillaceae bacterium]|nr:pyrrolidone-carboxylate peptidase [Azospirillaceae bacterium]